MEGKKYTGPRTNCTQCGKNFVLSEIITVSKKGETFCYSDCNGGCVASYVFKTGNAVIGEAMMFVGG